MSRSALFAALVLTFGCAAEPEPCDALCESAGFQGIEEFADGCYCSMPDGLGGELSQDACEGYCRDVGGSADEAALASTDTPNDTCLCESPA